MSLGACSVAVPIPAPDACSSPRSASSCRACGGPAALVAALQVAAARHRPLGGGGPTPAGRKGAVVSALAGSRPLTGRHAHPGRPSSGPAPPACCSPTCSTGPGIESVLVENRSPDYVEARIRAGILESPRSTCSTEAGLGERLRREGDEHRGIYLQWPGERHHLDFVDLVGRSVWVYGQTEVTKDLAAPGTPPASRSVYEVSDTRLHDLDPTAPWSPSPTRTAPRSGSRRDAVAGCDGSFGPSRAAVPARPHADLGARPTPTPGSASSPTSPRRPTS